MKRRAMTLFFIVIVCVGTVSSQSSTGSISGIVVDQNRAAIRGATVIIKNAATGFKLSTLTSSDGTYRFVNVPIGIYEVQAEAANFSKYIQTGITLDLNQEAIVDPLLRAGNIQEVVTISENASILNSTTAEVSTRFDSRRLSELPIASNRNVYNVLLSAPGVIQLAAGQTAFALGISFSANGGRMRSNSFLLDGQDINDPSLAGGQFPLNNPDAIQEVHIITNQFLAEYGRNTGSVVNFIGRSGTNDFRGSLFWFHNNENLNACSNTDKRAGFCDSASYSSSPPRRENQIGFTIGGPVILPSFGRNGRRFYSGRDKTFFFIDYQRWFDRRSPSLTLKGAPTAAGRTALQRYAGVRPQVQALLRFVPGALPSPDLQPVTVTLPGGASFDVERGDLTVTSSFKFDSDQGSFRIDHRFNENNFVYGRYRYSRESTSGAGQIAPYGFGTKDKRGTHAATIVWNSIFSTNVSNEARLAWKLYDIVRDGESQLSKSIPAIQINDLGMIGDRESERRTALGLSTNLPIIRTTDTYQLSDGVSFFKNSHSYKFGADLKRISENDLFFLEDRGSLMYVTLSDFVNDVAESGSRSLALRGGDKIAMFRWHELYFYAQDQWKIMPSLTLTYGIRYEYPGDSFDYLRDVNRRILSANGNDPVFRFEPVPKADTNNWMPRIGFSWNPTTSKSGIIGFITGGNKMVIRAGYARAYDANLLNTNQNILGSFPFRAAQNISGANAFEILTSQAVPDLSDLQWLNRMIVPANFHSPEVDQISFDIQRELSSDIVLRVGYIGTRGTGLIQTVDGNPRLPCAFGMGPGMCNTTGIDRNTGAGLAAHVFAPRINPNQGIVSLRTNSASSSYDALQASLEKRLSRGVSFGVHYTWSSLIDTASDVINLSVAELASAQDPFDLNAERARSGFDRPYRLAGNVVYELPFFTKQNGLIGKLLGGWQVNSLFTFQSGAPFTVLNGSDPAGVGSGAIRPNLFTNLDLSKMSVAQLHTIDQRLRAAAIAQAQRIFNSMDLGTGPCTSAAWLPGPPLSLTLFSAPRGRVLCDRGQRSLDVIFDGVLEGQRVGNTGRNILRSDSYKNVDIGIIKNTRISENVKAQLWVDLFNAFNWRNFGIPSGVASDPGFLNQWATDGGSRRIRIGARLVL